MQEEIENRSVMFIINSTKLTGRLLSTAMSKYLTFIKEKNRNKRMNGPVKPMGKQSIKQLIGQNQGVSKIEIADRSIHDFDRIARKYGVDYAVRKDRSSTPSKYLVFFKARDTDALTTAFQEYCHSFLDKKEHASIIEKLRSFTPLVQSKNPDKVCNKNKDLEL